MQRQLKIVRFYKSLRDRPPTFGGLALRYLPQHALLTASIFLAMLLPGFLPLPEGFVTPLRTFFAGLLVGAIMRDWGYSRRVLQSWPILSQVIDWNRVDALEHKLSASRDNG